MGQPFVGNGNGIREVDRRQAIVMKYPEHTISKPVVEREAEELLKAIDAGKHMANDAAKATAERTIARRRGTTARNARRNLVHLRKDRALHSERHGLEKYVQSASAAAEPSRAQRRTMIFSTCTAPSAVVMRQKYAPGSSAETSKVTRLIPAGS